METDDFPDPKEGLPRGIFQYNGSDTPMGPEYAALRELIEGDDEELANAAAAELAERYRASNIRAGIGLDSIYSEAEAETLHPLPGRRTSTGMRMFTDEDGQMNDEEALEEAAEAEAAAAAAGKPLRGAAAASAKAKAKAARAKAAADQAEEDAAADAAVGGDDDEQPDPHSLHTPEDPPMQIKMEWVLINKGERVVELRCKSLAGCFWLSHMWLRTLHSLRAPPVSACVFRQAGAPRCPLPDTTD